MDEEKQQPKIEISIKCEFLDTIPTMDTFCRCFLKDFDKKSKETIQTSPVVKDNLNPKFRNILCEYKFESKSNVFFDFYSSSPKKFVKGKPSTVSSMFIGFLEIQFSEIIRNLNKTMEFTISNPKLGERGKCFLQAENFSENKDKLLMNLRFDNLKKVNQQSLFSCFESFQPHILVERLFPQTNDWVEIHSEAIDDKYQTNLEFKVKNICDENYDQPFRISIFSKENTMLNTLQQSVEMSINSLKANKDKKYQLCDGSFMVVESWYIKKIDSYIDYIKGGLNIQLMVGIDFSEYNGSKNDPESLHFFQENKKNQYETVLEDIVSILVHYDSDKIVPMYGFGLTDKKEPINCIALHNDKGSEDTAGVLQDYRQFLADDKYTFNSPNLLSPILKILNAKVQNSSPLEQFIFLVLTNGQINDIEETVQAVVQSSFLPVSIILVGLGDNNDFSLLEFLDSDDERLIDKFGRIQQRDNLQFVEYGRQKSNSKQLKNQVLNELPDQIENQMGYKNITAKQINKLQDKWVTQNEGNDSIGKMTLDAQRKHSQAPVHETSLSDNDNKNDNHNNTISNQYTNANDNQKILESENELGVKNSNSDTVVNNKTQDTYQEINNDNDSKQDDKELVREGEKLEQ